MDNYKLAVSFRGLAYRDYIAARILLNKGYALQGLTLASSAIEKYIKVSLIAKGLTKKDINVHLDRFDKLKALLAQHYYDFTTKFDSRFLELLGKGYRARYYDNLTQPLMIGFFIGQFIGELDYAVNILDQIMTVSDENGNVITSPYRRAVNEKKPDLLENNYIFEGVSKKEFMERPAQGFGVYIDPVKGFNELEISGKDIKNSYDGMIAYIDVNFA